MDPHSDQTTSTKQKQTTTPEEHYLQLYRRPYLGTCSRGTTGCPPGSWELRSHLAPHDRTKQERPKNKGEQSQKPTQKKKKTNKQKDSRCISKPNKPTSEQFGPTRIQPNCGDCDPETEGPPPYADLTRRSLEAPVACSPDTTPAPRVPSTVR